MSKREVVDELHKLARKNFARRRVIIKGIDDLWQADLVEMGEYSSQNNGYKYLLNVIDTFSKYAWITPLKSKNAKDVARAMNHVFSAAKRIPKNLQTDDGKEFFNKEFQILMNKKKINHYSTYSVKKASIIERFNRTLKNMMWKEFSYNGSYKWLNIYKKLLEKYNNSKHRTIKMSPIDVNKRNEKLILNTSYNHIKIFQKPKFKIGDYVRISKYKHVFEKGYTPNWTTEIFQVHKIPNTNPNTYILKDYQGNVIKGGFYEYELMKTKYPNLYLVEKVIKKRGNRVYVKWLGFPNEHNSWINENEIL